MRQTCRTVVFIQASVSLGRSGQGSNPDVGLFLLLFKKYLFIWLSRVLFVALEIFVVVHGRSSCGAGAQDLCGGLAAPWRVGS